VATRAAAYRAGETIVDERSGDLHKYAWRKDVAHKEIVLPAQLSGDPQLDWARDRAILWNKVEHSERRRNSVVAHEYSVGLPAVLTPAQRLDLTRSFAQLLADRHRNAVDFAIHLPRPGRAPFNHAHLLATTREVTRDGLGTKTQMDRAPRSPTGWLRHMRREHQEVRAIWMSLVDRALHQAGIDKDTIPVERFTWKQYQERMRELGIDRNEMARRDRQAARLTDAERALVKERKEAIRQGRVIELAKRKERNNKRRQANRRARTPEQLEAQREANRAWYAGLSPTQMRDRRQRERNRYKSRSPEQVKRDARRHRKYYEQDPEKSKQRSHKHYEQNIEASKQRSRKYYKQNKAKYKQRAHERYKQNPEASKQRSREHYKKNKAKHNQRSRRNYEQNKEKYHQRWLERYKQDPEKYRQRSRDHYKKNKAKYKQRARRNYLKKVQAARDARATEMKQPTRTLTIDEIQTESAKAWAASRTRDQQSQAEQSPTKSRTHGKARNRDDDLAM